MFDIKFNLATGILETTINNDIKDWCNSYGGLIQVNNSEALDNLQRGGEYIVNLDKSLLYYSNVFTKTQTKHSSHFINVTNYQNGSFDIKDDYIPTHPISSFEGSIKLEINKISSLKFYQLKNKVLFYESNEDQFLTNLKKSIENGLTCINSNLGLRNLMSSLDQLEPEYFYELSISLAISGIQTYRNLIYSYIYNSNFKDETILSLIKNQDDLFFLLRILLFKYSISKKKKNLNDIKDCLKKIITIEQEYLLKLKKKMEMI